MRPSQRGSTVTSGDAPVDGAPFAHLPTAPHVRHASGGSLGLYLHVPFCASICNYCNFNRGLFDADLKRQYVSALVTEIRTAGRGEPADTIFFGGGTPSLLEPGEIGTVIEACRTAFTVDGDAEITLETNPETVTPERMAAFRRAGVNRVSLGVQSLHDDELARLGRTHDAARARQALADARRAGFDNVSLDLMLWLPQQDMPRWQATVDGLVALAPEHASLYLLELYPNAPLREAMARAQWSLAPDDDAADMYLWAMERLEHAGYEQYEISNVARPGRQSRHNLKYWQDGAWHGFGCGAHSTIGDRRWHNVSSTADYIRRVAAGEDPAQGRISRTRDERVAEALFTGLRLAAGVDLATVRDRYGVDAWERYGEALRPHVRAGRLVHAAGRLRLTREGMLVANDVMAVFV
jgi:oxygen-independent coproporphyrinogen III oxidase